MPERPSRTGFDYGGIEPEICARLEQEAARIRKRLFTAKRAAIEIGERLLQVKDLLPHGRFLEWVLLNCDFDPHTAQNFMNAARFARDHVKVARKLSQTGLFMLAAPRLDEGIRQRVIEAVERGEAASSSRIRALIKKERTPAAEPASDADGVAAGITELVSILVGGLAQADLERVLSIVSSTDADFSRLAAALAENMAAPANAPGQRAEDLARDVD